MLSRPRSQFPPWITPVLASGLTAWIGYAVFGVPSLLVGGGLIIGITAAGYFNQLEIDKFNAARDLGLAIIGADDHQIAAYIAMAGAIGYTAQVDEAFKVLQRIAEPPEPAPDQPKVEVAIETLKPIMADGQVIPLSFAMGALRNVHSGQKLPTINDMGNDRKYQALVHVLDEAGVVQIKAGRGGTILISRVNLLKAMRLLSEGRDARFVRSFLEGAK